MGLELMFLRFSCTTTSDLFRGLAGKDVVDHVVILLMVASVVSI